MPSLLKIESHRLTENVEKGLNLVVIMDNHTDKKQCYGSDIGLSVSSRDSCTRNLVLRMAVME